MYRFPLQLRTQVSPCHSPLFRLRRGHFLFGGGLAGKQGDKFLRVIENEVRFHGDERAPAVVTPRHRRNANPHPLTSFNIARLVAHEENIHRVDMLSSDDAPDHACLAEKLRRATDKFEQFEPVISEKDLHVKLGIRRYNSERIADPTEFAQRFRHTAERLDGINAAVQFFASAPRDAAHLARWNSQKPDELMCAHVSGLFEILWMQGAKTKLPRELVQDHYAGIKGVCNSAVEVKNHQLWRTGRLSPVSRAPQSASLQNVPSESSHVVTSSSVNSIVPLNFDSSGDSPKLPDTKQLTCCISSVVKAGLSDASVNSRSCAEL